jgi:hypothetical protein
MPFEIELEGGNVRAPALGHARAPEGLIEVFERRDARSP